MTVRSSAAGGADGAFIFGPGDEPANSGARRGGPRGPGSDHGAAAACVAVPGPRSQALAAVVDHLADRRRPRRRRALDGVRQPGRVRRDLLARLLACPAGPRQRRDPRLADDDVLRRPLLHAASAVRYAWDVERAARGLLRVGVERDVPAR